MDAQELEQRQADLLARIEVAQPDELEALETEIDEVRSQIDKHNAAVKKAEELRSRISTSTLTRPAVSTTVTTTADEPKEAKRHDTRSLVDAFVGSDSLREYREHRIGTGAQGRVDMEGIEARALITTVTTSDLSQTTRLPGIVNAVEDRPLRLADLVTTVATSGNSIEYVRDNSASPTGAAAEVAEGAVKPETTYTWELVQDSVKTVAHWTDITRQALDDEPQLRGLVQGRLFYGLGYRVDGQLLNGNGTGANIRGILNTTGINALTPATAEARIVSLRRAKTLVQHDMYAANVAVLNPDDWELVELDRDANGAWRVTTDPQGILAPRVWGMTVVETDTIAAGTAVIGDFRLGATLYDRQRASLYVTDSDGEKFRSNILTLLAELRVGFGVNRPAAFASITFNGTV